MANNIIDSMLNYAAQKLGLVPIVESGIYVMAEDIEAQSWKDLPVKFSKTFPENPSIMVSMASNSQGSRNALIEASIVYSSISKEGFTIRLYNNDTAPRKPGIAWQATYQPAVGGGAVNKIITALFPRWKEVAICL